MKVAPIFRRARIIFFALAFSSITLIGVGLWHSSASSSDKTAENKQKFNERLRDGVGTEVKFAKRDDGKDNVRASVNSLAHFMFTRSGVQLSGTTKNRLADMEAATLSNNARPISPDELSESLALTAVERVGTLSDADINHAAETLRGFNDPDLPESFQRGRKTVRMRADASNTLTPEQFIAQAKTVREANETSHPIFTSAAKNAIAPEVKKRANFLSDAIPEDFGAASTGLTPMQAVLIAYSTATCDSLTDSAANLQKHLKTLHEGLSKAAGQPYPSPNGHLAYGVNGYIFSTPTDLMFDDQTVNILLDRIQERGTIR